MWNHMTETATFFARFSVRALILPFKSMSNETVHMVHQTLCFNCSPVPVA